MFIKLFGNGLRVADDYDGHFDPFRFFIELIEIVKEIEKKK